MNTRITTYRLLFDGGESLDLAADSYDDARAKYKDLREHSEDYGDIVDVVALTDNARALEKDIREWVGKNYGTQEAENPCYNLTRLAKHLTDEGLTILAKNGGTITTLNGETVLVHMHVSSEIDEFRMMPRDEYNDLLDSNMTTWRRWLGDAVFKQFQEYLQNGEYYAEEVCIGR